jgi:hypothetical protein
MSDFGVLTQELCAGDLVPSTRRYSVTHIHRHLTLVPGDVVVIVETPSGNMLLRPSDMTIHALADHDEQYVHLEPA